MTLFFGRPKNEEILFTNFLAKNGFDEIKKLVKALV